MAPKRKRVNNAKSKPATKAAQGTRTSHSRTNPSDLIAVASHSYLDNLPAELVDRICDFLPHRDALLHLRATCRDLAAKTNERYGKLYWLNRRWLLTPSGWKQLSTFAEEHASIHSYMTTLSLVAVDSCRCFDSYTLAKGWGSSTELASTCSKLQTLKTLQLEYWKFQGAKEYVTGFCKTVKLPSLFHLHIDELVVEDVDLARLISNHKDTLHQVVLKDVDVYGGMNEYVADLAGDCDDPEDADPYRTPWTRVFEALLKIKDECGIQIDKAKHRGEVVDWIGNLSLADYDPDFGWGGYGMSIEPVLEDPDDENCEEFWCSVKIARDEQWKKSVYHMMQMYEYPIYDPDRDGTPVWFEQGEDQVEACIKRLEEEIKSAEPKSDLNDATGSQIEISKEGQPAPRRSSRNKSLN